jgi:hypothetical protein
MILGADRVKNARNALAHLRRARPVNRSKPPEIRAMALVASPASISGAVRGLAQAGDASALKTSAKPIPFDTHLSELFRIVKYLQ